MFCLILFAGLELHPELHFPEENRFIGRCMCFYLSFRDFPMLMLRFKVVFGVKVFKPVEFTELSIQRNGDEPETGK